MKTVKQIMAFGTAALWLVCGSVSAQPFENCELLFNTCPEEFDGKTISVPPNVIAISADIRACDVSEVFEGVSSYNTPPAVMFVIDHSRSMRMSASDGHDINGNRFRVTRALIDSIYAVYENAEVGIVIFADGLTLDANIDSNLVRFNGPKYNNANPARDRQAYMPLRRLDQPAKTTGTNPFVTQQNARIIDLYRGMFNVPANVNGRSAITGNINEFSGTDISIAFDAALEAFKNTSIPKENQYIVFLSDGEPSVAGCTGSNAANNPRCDLRNEFVNGTDVPTTYTVFLNSNATATTPPPQVIADMTNNIKNNGYSSSNVNSSVWVLQSNYSELLTLMMENIVSPMLTAVGGEPKKMVVKNATVTDSSNSLGNNGFRFTRPLGLNAGDSTVIEMGITYNVNIVESVDGQDSVIFSGDSLRTFSFTVVRSADNQTPGITVDNCKPKPTLSVQYNGAAVDTVKDYMNPLRVVFDQGGNSYSSVAVQIMNAAGTVLDTAALDLTKSGNLWSGDFSRAVADIIKNDKALQHKEQDSIIVVFRNPYLPLDTARIALPYISTYMAFYDKAGNPQSATLFPDTVSVTAGFEKSIFVKFFGPDGGWLQEYETDNSMSSRITWSVNEPQNAELSQTSGITATFKSTAANKTYRVTATFTYGQTVITRSIYVKVDPITMALYEGAGDPASMQALPQPFTGAGIVIIAGTEKAVFAKLFDPEGKWISAYETDEELRSKITWAVDKSAELSSAVGNSTKFMATAAHRTYQVTATLTLHGFSVSASVLIRVDPAQAEYLDIVRDTLTVDRNNKSNFNEVTLEKEAPSVKIWAVERDKYGNLVRVSPNAEWGVINGVNRVNLIESGDGSAVVERGKGAGDDIYITVNGKGVNGAPLKGDELRVIVIGETSVAIGPNPFIPGQSVLGELPPAAREYYKEIINVYGGEGKSGILIAVESARPVRTASLKIMIYDAVGNVVLSANTKGKLAESNTYGFVWDGKNSRGRTVGPGTYLMKISGVQDNGEKFQPPPKKIGVAKAK